MQTLHRLWSSRKTYNTSNTLTLQHRRMSKRKDKHEPMTFKATQRTSSFGTAFPMTLLRGTWCLLCAPSLFLPLYCPLVTSRFLLLLFFYFDCRCVNHVMIIVKSEERRWKRRTHRLNGTLLVALGWEKRPFACALFVGFDQKWWFFPIQTVFFFCFRSSTEWTAVTY